MKRLVLFLILGASLSLAHAASRKILLSGEKPAAEEDEPSNIELEIRTVDIKITLHGMLASTRIEFSVYNPSTEEAQADFIFPLPPNSAVTGYALDIDGQMVDGVYVEKQKARFTYKEIVSRMIDPGLLEARDDNSFSINIYPVPEQGKRVFNVEFITDLSSHPYELPLNYKGRVQEVALAIEAKGFTRLPRIRFPQGMNSRPDRGTDGFYVENRWQNIGLKGELSIQSETPEQDRLIIEKSAAGDYYFLLDDYIDEHAAVAAPAPDHITLLWDASLSRLHSNTAAELKLLKRLLKNITAKNPTVDVVVFKDRPEQAKTHRLQDGPRPLLEDLEAIHYDGASNLEAALDIPISADNDYCLLFTDGKINYGPADAGAMPCRMYVVSSGSEVNRYLEHLALQSGGDYFQMTADPDSIVEGILSVPLRLSSITNAAGIEEIYTETARPVDGRLRVSGRLALPKAAITLNYATGDGITRSKTFQLKQEAATNAENARRMWALNKIGMLQRAAHPDRQAIVDLSRHHGVLSPYTSLLVLEDPDQYVEHRIEPPAAKKEWVKEYFSRVKDPDQERQAYVETLAGRWNELVKWWYTDFASRPKKASTPRMRALSAEDIGRMPDTNLRESLQRARDIRREGVGVVAADEEVVVTGIRGSLEEPASPGPSISVKPWTPDRVYLGELNKAAPEAYFEKYLELRPEYGQLPAYYIEVADFLRNKNQNALALQVLSNLTELDTSDYTSRRVLGYKLLEYGELDLAIRILESVLEENADEPQSFRDLALALIRRADTLSEKGSGQQTAAIQDYLRGIDLLYSMALKLWDSRFEGIELIALMELNRAIARCKALGLKTFKVDSRLVKLLDVDMRAVASWQADLVDIDLWVIEPTGEIAMYSNALTAIGGRLSNDMTEGFGPEEYLLKKAPKGKYTIKVHYFGSQEVMPTGAVKLLVDVYTNYGRKNEKKEVLTIELEKKEDQYMVGEIEF